MTLRRVAVLGVGNPVCGDDGVGVRVAELVAHAFQDSRVCVKTAPLEPARLLSELEDCDAAVLVDACKHDGAPGQVRVFYQWPFPTNGSASTHGFGLAEALALGASLGVLPEALRVVTVSGARFEAGEPMSQPVRLGAIRAAWQVVNEVSQWLDWSD